MVAICPILLRADLIAVNPPEIGSLPIITTAFVNGTTGDVYKDSYVFTLFDTGSTRVALDSATASFLGLTSGTLTTLRLNGLGAIDPATLNAPIYTGAQAEIPNIGLQVTGLVDVPLIGAPVANQTLAKIDYTDTITRGPYTSLNGASISGPDITFYSGSNTPGYRPAIQLSLDPIGVAGTSNGIDIGLTYLMYGVAFNEGPYTVASATSGDLNLTPNRFLYDTGTNVTLIDSTLATSLGLDLSSPDFHSYVGSDYLPGFYIDSLTMTGTGGTYTLKNVPILVGDTQGKTAVIGSNLFASTEVLFDGAGDTLGIGEQAVPEPSSVLLLAGVMVALIFLRRRALAG
jgi:hypothetical protein